MVVSSKAIKLVATQNGQSIAELREHIASRLQVMLNTFAKAASRICRKCTSATRPS